jgi:CubicO group peptidase (beta-lactamase class C family)
MRNRTSHVPRRAWATLVLLPWVACIPFGEEIPDTRCSHGTVRMEDPSFSRSCRAEVVSEIEQNTVYDGVVAMRGETLLMRWGSVDRPTNLASVRKSLISLLFGIAAERRLVDLDATLEELGIDDAPQPLTAAERAATVRDLLASRSGIYLPTLGESASWAARRPARGAYEPGAYWFYNNWDFNALGTIFEKVTGLGIGQAISEWLAQPLGMTTFCPDHVTYEYADFTEHPMWRVYMSAEDLALVGALVVQDGRWGEEQIVPSAWIEESTAPISDTSEFVEDDAIYDHFGLLWWVDADTGRVWASGSGGQFLIIDRPNKLATVVRNNTGASIPGRLWYTMAHVEDEDRASEARAAAVHAEVASCE